MTERLFLSRRNLLTLLSKLDRAAKGETTACTIIKYRNESDPLVNTIDAISVTAVEDEDLYGSRSAGPMHPLDDPDLRQVKGFHFSPGGKKPDVHTRDAPPPRIVIDLSELSESPLLVGRDFGFAMAELAQLDDRDNDDKLYRIILSDEIYSLSTSFFLGMFEPSIRRLGIEKFKEKYFFDFRQPFIDVAENGVIRIKQELAVESWNK